MEQSHGIVCAMSQGDGRGKAAGIVVMGQYTSEFRKELSAWKSFPHTASMSEQIKVYAAKNRHIPKRREARMCQACGAVSIIGGERLLSAERSKHGHFYCDKECAESDRSRVYRTSALYQQTISNRYDKDGKLRSWEKRVCKIYDCQCSICSKRFYGRNNKSVPVCSPACRKRKYAIDAWIANRKKQTPKETQCTECGAVFTALTRTAFDYHYCSASCSRSHSQRNVRHVRRERIKMPEGSVRGKVSLKSQYAKFQGVCQICNCKTVMAKQYQHDQATVDHIVPLAKGGLHVEENVQLACIECNSRKADSLSKRQQLLLL
jgi:5-methylcytosine-specific restriction endonuclease McrA